MCTVNPVIWGEFKISDIFKTVQKGNKIQVPTGASVSANKLIENGKTPRITVTNTNNGIFGYFDCKEKDLSDYRIYTNFISVSFLGTVFYHKAAASLDMKVHCLKPLNIILNEYTGTYLVGAIKASLRGYTYSDQLSSTLLPTLSIKLPITSCGAPDWDYMENYIRNLNKYVKNTLNNLLESEPIHKKKIDISAWGEFKIGGEDGLFDVYTGGDLILYKTAPGNIPVISHSRENNGIQMFAERIADRPLFNHTRTISLADRGNFKAFVQDEDFYIGTRVKALLLKDKYPTPKRTVLQFMAVVIDGLATKFCYKENATDSLIYQKIKLPINDKGNIDWKYIEDYMQNITNSVDNAISFLLKGIS